VIIIIIIIINQKYFLLSQHNFISKEIFLFLTCYIFRLSFKAIVKTNLYEDMKAEK
jgi:hypothetical protein